MDLLKFPETIYSIYITMYMYIGKKSQLPRCWWERRGWGGATESKSTKIQQKRICHGSVPAAVCSVQVHTPIYYLYNILFTIFHYIIYNNNGRRPSMMGTSVSKGSSDSRALSRLLFIRWKCYFSTFSCNYAVCTFLNLNTI